jgi:amino acid adenylation domain-containing protein
MIATTPALLSLQQERVRRLQQGGAPSPYRVRAVVEVTGAIDVERLHAALRQVVADSPVFHTPFDSADDQGAPDAMCDTSVALPGLPGGRGHGSRAAFDESVLDALDRRSRDNRRAAVISVIASISEARALWALQAPALVADEQTLRLLVERTVNRYLGHAEPEGEGLSPLTYAEYVDWQQEMMRDPETASARAYWQQQPFPDASRFRLPIVRDGRAPADFRPGYLTRQLENNLTGELKRLAPKARMDLSTWLFAAWQVLLWRHLDTPSVQVGLFLDGRAHPALGDVLGPCARYAPVQIEIAPRSTLAEIARRTVATMREHAIWQDCCSWEGFDRGGLDAPALAHHAFGFDWHASGAHAIGGGNANAGPTFRIRSLFATLERFDVRLIATRVGRRVECQFEWNRGQYDEADIAQLADRYLALLADAVQHPNRRVADLEIVGQVEREHLLVRGRGPEEAAPADRCIHASIEEHAARDETRTAVVAGPTRLTYGDLNRKANALAARVRAAGLEPGGRVAICLPRTADQFVAMLAVLKAGGAFVPLDPAVPMDRLAWTVTDSKASILIAPALAASRVPANEITVLAPDDVGLSDEAAVTPSAMPHIDGHPNAQACALGTPDPGSPAYVIYTSGSTGRPKGVVVSHRNLVHSTDARRTHYRKPVGSYLLVSPVAFDSAMAGVFWTLCSGGTLVLPADDEHNDPAALRRLIEQHGITHVLCLPSLYAWVLDAEYLQTLRSLQVVIVAGESCPVALTDRHQRLLPQVELHNEYGPTECSVWSTVYQAGTVDEQAGVPIGRPIARARVYIAERPWRLSPSGLPGEGLIGGAGVADGYLDRADLTAERFVPDPWSDRPGARLYRTGDRLRWLANSQIDFLGRVDHQVKLRGYRIELEEIEASISAHPEVRECAVAVRGDAGAERLIGYVVPEGTASGVSASFPDRIREFLGTRLPPYMVPAAIAVLDALPKTPNGKVDRARLPEPSRVRGAGGPAAHPPSTPTEVAIAAVWQELLGRDQIGIHDTFFDLGGHSLMAIAIFGRLRGGAPNLRLVDLFEHPTVHALAEFIDGMQSAPAAEGTTAITTTTAAIDDARTRQQALRRKRAAARTA